MLEGDLVCDNTQYKKRIINIALLCCSGFTSKLLKENGDHPAFHARFLPKWPDTRPKIESHEVYQEDHHLPEDDGVNSRLIY